MVDPAKFALIAGPIALVAIAIIQGYFALKVAEVRTSVSEVKGVVTKVEEQTNSRLTALLKKVDELESTIATNANRRTDDKIDQLAQDVKDAKK